jgi:hypothetical protein
MVMTFESAYNGSPANGTASLTDAVVETFVRWPMRMTGATMEFVMDGVQRMAATGSRPRGDTSVSRRTYASPLGTTTYASTSSTTSSAPAGHATSGWSSLFSGEQRVGRDHDLGGNDLKYVIWSLVFTKPGYECVLQTQQEELVNYAADPNTYAALKIARFLDGARHGHSRKPESWFERGYPAEFADPGVSVNQTPGHDLPTSGRQHLGHDPSASAPRPHRDGWRVPAEDQKFIVFLYHVERRLPRQEEIVHTERVVVERDTRIA